MGSDVSVVLHPDAPVPGVVISAQAKADVAGALHPPPPSIKRCPVIRVLEAQAAKRLAGDSSAASATSTADLHPQDQPRLLIRNCAELDAFTKSRTYVPVLRAIHAYLDSQDGGAAGGNRTSRDANAPRGGVSFQQRLEAMNSINNNNSNNNTNTGVGLSQGAARPVCPIGLVFDASLALGGRVNSNESRAACAQYLKLFFVHLIAALEFVREPDDAMHTKWPSSPGVLKAREASVGATSTGGGGGGQAAALPPRLSILYLDLRHSSLDDATAKWFVSGVVMRAVRRARPFLLVSARGNAAGVSSTSSSAGGATDTFMNYYSPDVKADMVWATLQHVLLTNNPKLTESGARAVLEELLAGDATREVVLRQQGIDPKAQRAQDVQRALTCDRLTPRPDTQLLPQLYLVDLLRDTNGDEEAEGSRNAEEDRNEASQKPSEPAPSTSRLLESSRGEDSVATGAAAAGSIPPSPQHRPPQPTARVSSPVPADAPQAKVTAAPLEANIKTDAEERQQLKPDQNTTRPPAAPQQKQKPLAGRGKAAQAPRQELRAAAAQLPPQQPLQKRKAQQPPQQPLQPSALAQPVEVTNTPDINAASSASLSSPPHPPPQQRVVRLPKPTPLAANPAPSHSPDLQVANKETHSKINTTAAATDNKGSNSGQAKNASTAAVDEVTRDDSPPLPQLQRPSTPPATPPQSRAAAAATTRSPPARRALEATNTPAEVQASAQPPTPALPSPPSPTTSSSSTSSSSIAFEVEAEDAKEGGEAAAPRAAEKRLAASPPPPLLQRRGSQSKHASSALTTAPAAAEASPSASASVAALQKDSKHVPQQLGEQDREEPVFIRMDTPLPPDEPEAAVVVPTPVSASAKEEAAPPAAPASAPPEEEPTAAGPKLPSPRAKRTGSVGKKRTTRKTGIVPWRGVMDDKFDSQDEEAYPQQQEDQQVPESEIASARPLTTSTPPKLSRSTRANRKAPAHATTTSPAPRHRNASPSRSRRVQDAMATAEKLDDVPDAVIKGHSARKPRTQSPRPDVRCYSPSAPLSARQAWSSGQNARLPTPSRHHDYFHSPVRPESLELEKAQAMLEQLRSQGLVSGRSSRGRATSTNAAGGGGGGGTGAVTPPPLVISPRRSRHMTDEVNNSHTQNNNTHEKDDGVARTSESAAEVKPEQPQEEPWLDHAHPIENSSVHDSVAQQRQPLAQARHASRRYGSGRLSGRGPSASQREGGGATAAPKYNDIKNGVFGVGGVPAAVTATPRSARRRNFDIAALDPPEEQFAAAAAHVTPAMWEEAVRKRHPSPAQAHAQAAAARRRGTSPRSGRRGTPTSARTTTNLTADPAAATDAVPRNTAYDDVRPRTDTQRHRDSVAEAKAAYEAATLAEARAKALMEQRAQKRQLQQTRQRVLGGPSTPSSSPATATHRQRRNSYDVDDSAIERGASLRVEGEVDSEHGDHADLLFTPVKAEADSAAAGGTSPSPAPNRPTVGNTPSSVHENTNQNNNNSSNQHSGALRGANGGHPHREAASAAAGAAGSSQPVYARRRISTAQPPHIAPRLTTTSQLRKLTSQRCRRASEVEAQISGFYAHAATPRRDFRNAAAVASMAVRQPTREELTAVQLEQHFENDRRQSIGGYRRPSTGAAGVKFKNGYEANPMSHDVSNPALIPQRRSQISGGNHGGATSSSKAHASSLSPLQQQQQQQQQQRWTPAYQHSGRNTQGSRDGDDYEETSSVPSLSPWGTADYQGSAPRHDDPAAAGLASPGNAVEVNEYGVELVHQALRTQRRPRY